MYVRIIVLVDQRRVLAELDPSVSVLPSTSLK